VSILRFARALRLRCPDCGAGPVTQRWFGIRPACPRCRLRLDRGEPDYFLGAWPTPPWNAIYYGGIVGMILAPVFFYPFSKLCWLAFDLMFRPPRPEDFEA